MSANRVLLNRGIQSGLRGMLAESNVSTTAAAGTTVSEYTRGAKGKAKHAYEGAMHKVADVFEAVKEKTGFKAGKAKASGTSQTAKEKTSLAMEPDAPLRKGSNARAGVVGEGAREKVEGAAESAKQKAKEAHIPPEP